MGRLRSMLQTVDPCRLTRCDGSGIPCLVQRVWFDEVSQMFVFLLFNGQEILRTVEELQLWPSGQANDMHLLLAEDRINAEFAVPVPRPRASGGKVLQFRRA